jgi:hypothetical protein
MAVCCQNLPLGALSSRSAPSVLVGALFKKFGLFLNTGVFLKLEIKLCYEISQVLEPLLFFSHFDTSLPLSFRLEINVEMVHKFQVTAACFL